MNLFLINKLLFFMLRKLNVVLVFLSKRTILGPNAQYGQYCTLFDQPDSRLYVTDKKYSISVEIYFVWFMFVKVINNKCISEAVQQNLAFQSTYIWQVCCQYQYHAPFFQCCCIYWIYQNSKMLTSGWNFLWR